MKDLYRILADNSNIHLISIEDKACKKGERRFITTSYSAFTIKREQLKNQGVCLKTRNLGEVYCIEW